MSSETDEPAAYLRLLQEAGLSRIEHLLDHDPSSLHVRLTKDNRKLNLLEPFPGEEIISRLKGEAEQHREGEITVDVLRDLWPEGGSDEGRTKSGLAMTGGQGESGRGHLSFDVFRQDFGLPGKEDFDLPRRKGDEDL